MVNEFNDIPNKRGGLNNRWLDFSLRENVRDGRCYRERERERGQEPAKTSGPQISKVSRLQTAERIVGWETKEYPDKDNDLLVSFVWGTEFDMKTLNQQMTNCQLEIYPGSLTTACLIDNTTYTGAGITLWRIDDPNVAANGFHIDNSPKTKIGYIPRIFKLGQDDTGQMVPKDGGSRVTLRSDLKWIADPTDPSQTWQNLIYNASDVSIERTNGRLQTDKFYFFTVETFFQTWADGQGVSTQTAEFKEILPYDSDNPKKRPYTSQKIGEAVANDWVYWQTTQTHNDYFAWFQTPKSFEGKRRITPGLYFGLLSEIRSSDYFTNGTITNPDENGTVKAAVQTGDPTKFDVTLNATFFYPKIDLGLDNYPKLPDDEAEEFGIMTRNLSVAGSQLQKVSDIYLGNKFFFEYTQDLPQVWGGRDTSRKIELTYNFTIEANTTWEYVIYVRKKNGDVWYANTTTGKYSLDILASQTPGLFQITSGQFVVQGWVNPPSHDKGFWFQSLRCWARFTDQTRLSPYMTVLKKPFPGQTPVLGQNTAVDNDYPLFYYLNYTFQAESNYQFRTILEDFFRIENENGISTQYANLKMTTPWGEIVDMKPPFFNTLGLGPGMARINMYFLSNINAYSGNNNQRIKNSLGLVREKPNSIISSKHNPQNPITYSAKPYFGGDTKLPKEIVLVSGINWVGISKIDWFMQGCATFNVMGQTTNGTVQTKGTEKIPYFLFVNNNVDSEPFGGRGWHYISEEKKFVWFDKIGDPTRPGYIVELNDSLPIGGDPNNYYSDKKSHLKYLNNNFIATYIPYQNFNVSFDYINDGPFGVSMYIGGNLPFVDGKDFWKTDIDQLISKGLVKFIGKLGKSTGRPQNCEFVGLVGNQFLFFVADTVIKFGDQSAPSTGVFDPNSGPNDWNFKETSFGYPINTDANAFGYLTYSVATLYNFKLSGAYNQGNNLVYTVDQNMSADLKTATYSIKLGSGNNVFPNSANLSITTYTRAGNGSFLAGIWENGVWNDGWRQDNTVAEFNKVEQSFFYNRGRVWRITISGRPQSVAKFSVGDTVSISNVVAIDINENRKLLNKSYRVLSIDDGSLTLETDTNFPIKRIEKDSEDHRILISKNVWLNGVFLNGYFSGIWNNGLLSGYPMITKMEKSHWIDGIFNGGHFNAQKIKVAFDSAKSMIQDGTSRLALSFASGHGLEVNDTISITYSTLNTLYTLGTTVVIAVPDPVTVVTGIVYDNKYKVIKNGMVNTTVSDGLIQNFTFYSNNISTVTSLDTMRSERVFSYNSWIDVNYSNKSAVNVGRPQTFIDEDSERSYSENNLYGYPTNDVLSSESIFRDSFSLTSRRYRLGRKYRILNDFVGESSLFEKAFGPTETADGNQSFEEQGWEISKRSSTNYKIYSVDVAKVTNKLQVTFTLNEQTGGLSVGDVIVVSGAQIEYVQNFFGQQNGWSSLTPQDTFGSEQVTIESVTPDAPTNTVAILTSSTLFAPFGLPQDGTREWDLTQKNGFYVEFEFQPEVNIARTSEPVTADTPLVGKEMGALVTGNGGVINLIPVDDVNGRTNGKRLETLSKLRYTMVEFELVDFKTTGLTPSYSNDDKNSAPPLHFNNLNFVTRETRDVNSGAKIVKSISATYLPIFKNVSHVTTPGRKKQEFFFNKRNLQMNLTGTGTNGQFNTEFYLDNLKFYEVDMIPFFQYFRNPILRSGNINISVQIPNTGNSPNLVPTEEFVDAASNDVVNKFVDLFVASNVQVPKNVNWKNDYAVYRTQRIDATGDPGLYKNI